MGTAGAKPAAIYMRGALDKLPLDSDLSQDEAAAVLSYTGILFKSVNLALRGADQDFDKKVCKFSWLLATALSKLTKCTKEGITTVYRGAAATRDMILSPHTVGDVFDWKSFTSTTT